MMLPEIARTPRHPVGYTRIQIILHWVIAALVIFQLVFGEDIVPAYQAFMRGTQPPSEMLVPASIHVYVGISILVLALLRVAVRLHYGAPVPPVNERPFIQFIAKLAHLMLYAMIFVMPLTGMFAWYFEIEAIGELHELAKPLVIALLAVHTAGALWQHFVDKTDVLKRILRPLA